MPTRRSIRASNHVSSCSSRSAFSDGGEPISAMPPGIAQRLLSDRWMSTTWPEPSNAAMLQPIFGVGIPRSGRYGRSGVKSAAMVSPASASAMTRVR